MAEDFDSHLKRVMTQLSEEINQNVKKDVVIIKAKRQLMEILI